MIFICWKNRKLVIMAKFVVKNDLKKLGFSDWQSMMLVKQAKAKLASQGLTWYESKGLGRVPLETVEEILGVKIDEEDFNKPVEALNHA
jgi:hypothetical protein